MKRFNMVQGSPEWHEVRLGRITSSRICDVLNYLKNGSEGADRRKYRWELVAERLTGQPRENGAAYAARVKWGVEQEPFARDEYTMRTNVLVDKVGFIEHPRLPFTGGSPDALVGTDGLLEIKCPDSITHVQWLDAGVIPADHIHQCLWNLACSERDWIDFVSFDPRIKIKDAQMMVVRMGRDDAKFAEIEAEVIRFDQEINAAIAKLGGL
jgi:hypothetical protein